MNVAARTHKDCIGSQLLVREATLADDDRICAQIQRNSMPGPITLTTSHTPSFFESIEVEGYAHRVVVGERDGDIVGVGMTAKRLMYINGVPTEVGHLSSLRTDPAIRNTRALARGFQLFKEWHDEGFGVPFYLCTILKENKLARRIISSGRAGLPASHDIGVLYTAAIPVIKRPYFRPPSGLSIVRGDRVGAQVIVEYLNRVGQTKQFFPVYRIEELLSPGGAMRGLNLEDFHVALAGDRIVGVTACWNQMAFRRIVVAGYEGGMKWLEPLLSPLARALRLAPLPNPGDAIRSVLAACIAVEDNDPKVFQALLANILRSEYNTGKTFLLVGLMEGDPLLAVVRKYLHVPTRSCIQALEWEGAEALAKLDGRLPYMELGSL